MTKIIFISLIPNTIGDILFLIPIFRIIKENNKDYQISITISASNYDLLKKNPDIDEIIIIKNLDKISENTSKIKKVGLYFIIYKKLYSQLKKNKYDLAIIGQPNFIFNQFIPFLARIKIRIGYYYGNLLSKILLTHKIKFIDPLKSVEAENRHFIDSYLDLVGPLNLKFNRNNLKVIKKVDINEINKVKELLKQNKINKEYICIQAGSKWPSKNWPKKNFRELCSALSKENKIILLGSRKEYVLNEYIKDDNKDIINFSGLELSKVAAILKLSKLLIGNDSGLTHLSTAVGTNTITLYGTTSYNHSKPLGTGKHIPIFSEMRLSKKLVKDYSNKYYKNMNNIPVKKILSKVNELLK